jgi:hypothetical protein
MTIDEIKIEVEQYQIEIQKPIPVEINSCIDRLSYLAGIHSRIGYLLVQTKKIVRKIKDDRLSIHLNNIRDNFLSSKIQNALIDGFAIEETYVLELLEKQSNSCTIQMDTCRTIISKEKEEMKFAGITPKN